jgi:hypothetical protein
VRQRHGSSVAFNDLLFNVLVGFVLLFILAFILINPIAKTGDIPSKAEIMIILEWDENSQDDIDLWVQFENHDPVGYSNKEEGAVFLDRDDLGDKNDMITINGKPEIIRINRETITIRGIVPGRYYVGVHVYNKEGNERLRITVTVIDVNPYREIYSRNAVLHQRGEKYNMPGFELNAAGEIIDAFDHVRNLGPKQLLNGQYDDNIFRQQLREGNGPL